MKKYFLTGLVTLLPVAVTVWITVVVVRFLTRPFMGVMTHLLSKLPKLGILTSERGIQTISEILILIALFVFTVFLGLIARRFFIHSLINLGDTILYRIPLVNKVYKTSKEIVSSLFAASGDSFKQVVLLPFPCKGATALDSSQAQHPSPVLIPQKIRFFQSSFRRPQTR